MEYQSGHKRKTPREVWLTRADWQSVRDRSIEHWKDLSVEEREAVTKFVRAGMENLYDTVEDWIPEALRVEVGECLEVSFKIFFTEIRDNIDRSQKASTFRIREAIAENDRMVQEMKDLAGE